MTGIRIRTADRDEARELCARVYFPHRLGVFHEPSRFAMSLSAANIGPVSAGLLGYAGEVRLETGELESGYQVNVPLTGELCTDTGHGRVRATPEFAAVYRPDGRTMLQGWRDGGRLFGLKIERSALETELAELVDHPVESVIPLGASLDLRSDPGRQWWALARSLVELIRAPEGPLARPMVARPLVHSVIAALLYAVDHPHRGLLEAEVAAPRAAAIRQAVELLDAEPERPWTVGEIARRVGVGPRALQNGFGRHVGVAPMAYLRQIRLSRVHADLRDSDPGRHTVAELAGRWGFSHLGRFAEVYRRRYGCAPSQTLHAGG